VVVISLTPSSGLCNSGDCDEHAQGGGELKYVRDLNQFQLSKPFNALVEIVLEQMKSSMKLNLKVCTD
jgi:hypothetical protein